MAQSNDKIINFLFEIATLRRITRHDRQVIPAENSNISDHSFRTAIIGMILAKLENCDENKVLKMCLFHDIAEARTGDANFINKSYINDVDEKRAIKDQMEDLPIEKEMIELLEELEKNESIEAKTAHDADVLDQMILQQEYFSKEEKNARIWHNYSIKFLKTGSAKAMAGKIKKTDPMEWFYRFAEEKAGEKLDEQ